MTKEEQNYALDLYLNLHYDKFKKKMMKMCEIKHFTFDEDVFQDTIYKVLTKVREVGLKAKNAKEIENYLFRAFVLNTYQNHQQIQKRREDLNVDVDWVIDEREEYDFNNDVLMDYLTALVEFNFTIKEAEVWKTKYFSPNEITYRDLKRICNVKSPRKIVTKINTFLKDNINYDLIKCFKDANDI